MQQLVTSILTVCPIRLKPDDTSEMVSQLLFGEEAMIIEKGKSDWVKVKCIYDNYEGWMDRKQLVESQLNTQSKAICLDILTNIFADQKSTWISMGSELRDYDGMLGYAGGHKFRFSGQAVLFDQLKCSGEIIDKLAKRLLNVPYLWGGRSPLGIDCSGFTQVIFKSVGLQIARDARDQALTGTPIDFVSEAKVGDLAFFSKQTEKITHVGIVLEEGKIIHASGSVRIDTLDHYGVFNQEKQEYTHRLKIIKRYF